MHNITNSINTTEWNVRKYIFAKRETMKNSGEMKQFWKEIGSRRDYRGHGTGKRERSTQRVPFLIILIVPKDSISLPSSDHVPAPK
jgi:hypothetical protein